MPTPAGARSPSSLRDRFPRYIAELMDEAEHDVLAYMAFDESLRSKLQQHQPAEEQRQQGDQAPHQRASGSSLTAEAVVRLVGALMLEQNDEWAVSRRYMPVEKLRGHVQGSSRKTAKIAAQ